MDNLITDEDLKLAEQKGFVSNIRYLETLENNNTKDCKKLRDYLWLCELQQWLLTHGKYLIIAPTIRKSIAHDDVIRYVYSTSGILLPYFNSEEHNTYCEALYYGVIEHLKTLEL